MTKKKQLISGLLAVAVFGTVLTACNNDDDDNGPVNTPKEVQLSEGAWSLRAAMVADSSMQDSSILSACNADDSLAFNLNHDYAFSDGGTTCDSSLLPYGSGNWAFNMSEDSIQLQSADAIYTAGISLTDSTLELTYADMMDDSVAVTKTLSFARTAPADTTGE
ncbi:hypothetical protein [Compostibacter hankyongensis]|uniref:Lipocalin-like domain-containing protein n=1 Tax=Compostibacter hankyongensis TaxID=1007089 RepID=A0ABP8FTG4_9BACT